VKQPETVVTKEHLPIQIVAEELVYHISTGISISFSFMATKGVLAVKLFVCLSIKTKSLTD
jgi:hypothetical protein